MVSIFAAFVFVVFDSFNFLLPDSASFSLDVVAPLVTLLISAISLDFLPILLLPLVSFFLGVFVGDFVAVDDDDDDDDDDEDNIDDDVVAEDKLADGVADFTS